MKKGKKHRKMSTRRGRRKRRGSWRRQRASVVLFELPTAWFRIKSF